LNLIALHNIYEIRDLQLKKYERNHENNECEYLKNIARINLEKEKKAIINRLKQIKGGEINLNSENFNDKIDEELKNFNQIDDRAIKSSDFSYNLVHVENFTNVGLFEYKL